MNIKEIKEIIELMKENNIREFEIERDGLRISLKRGMAGGQEVITVTQPSQQLQVPIESKTEEQKEQVSDNISYITSPMVGTFYSSPAPDAASYADIGQNVNVNEVICIIEAMKVMNEIKSEVKGRIKEILVKNGEPVEFGQPLFAVEVK